jgi:hypothetical protein
MVSQVESCYAQKQAYTNCVGAAELNPTGLVIGNAAGEVSVASADAGQGYVIVGYSRSGNTFTITKDGATGATTRTCTAGGASNGGCDPPNW